MIFTFQGKNEKSPNYKVSGKVGTEFVDLGWGWKKTSAKGTPFLSLSLDAEGLKKVYKDKYDKLTSAGTPIPFSEQVVIDENKAFENF